MDEAEHFRRLERMYQVAPCNQIYKPELTVSLGQADLVIAVSPSFFHAGGAVHGSVYFKALDDAAYFAVNSLVDDVIVLTASFHIHLLRPVSSGELRASGRVVRPSKTLFVAESWLTDLGGRELARGSGDFVRSKRPLKDVPGYAD